MAVLRTHLDSFWDEFSFSSPKIMLYIKDISNTFSSMYENITALLAQALLDYLTDRTENDILALFHFQVFREQMSVNWMNHDNSNGCSSPFIMNQIFNTSI